MGTSHSLAWVTLPWEGACLASAPSARWQIEGDRVILLLGLKTEPFAGALGCRGVPVPSVPLLRVGANLHKEQPKAWLWAQLVPKGEKSAFETPIRIWLLTDALFWQDGCPVLQEVS